MAVEPAAVANVNMPPACSEDIGAIYKGRLANIKQRYIKQIVPILDLPSVAPFKDSYTRWIETTFAQLEDDIEKVTQQFECQDLFRLFDTLEEEMRTLDTLRKEVKKQLEMRLGSNRSTYLTLKNRNKSTNENVRRFVTVQKRVMNTNAFKMSLDSLLTKRLYLEPVDLPPEIYAAIIKTHLRLKDVEGETPVQKKLIDIRSNFERFLSGATERVDPRELESIAFKIGLANVLLGQHGGARRNIEKQGHMLDVGDGHQIYYEQHGAVDGRPVVVLHGGPGGGLQRSVLRLFDLHRWRVTLYDQRGCGRSTPFGSLHANTTRHLVADIERLRKAVGVDRWLVFGGSWGSTLALAYAQAHPTRVTGLVLRGICLMSPWEQEWMYGPTGAAKIRPAAWSAFMAPVPRAQRSSWRRITARYGRLLRNRKTRKAAARAWWGWENALSTVAPRPDTTPESTATSLALLENHYFRHNAWLSPGQLVRGARRLRKIPTAIVQGALDLVCPPAAAVELKETMPHARLTLVPNAGHATSEPGIAEALKAAIRSMAAR